VNNYQLGDIPINVDEEDPGGLTPEELAQQQQADGLAPPPFAPIPPAPDMPGPADGFIDQVNAEPLAAPIPGTVTDDAAWPPPVPAGAPGMVPPGGAAPAPNAPPGAAPTAESTTKAQTALDVDAAKVTEQQALQAAAEQQRHQEAAEAARVEAAQRVQEAHDNLDAKIATYDANRTLRDPRSTWTTVDKVANIVGVLFGALGGGLSAAGGGSGENKAVTTINHRLEAETERQKFNISRMADDVAMAKAGVQDANLARAELIQDEDARHVSRLNTIIAQGTATLAAKKVPQAQIAGDTRLLQLQAARAAALQKSQLDAAKLAEVKARTELLTARAGKLGRRAGAGGGGGAGEAAIARAIENGAAPSAVRELGAKLRIPPKRIDALETQGRAAATAAAKAGATGDDNPLAVRDGEGVVRGLAPSARVVKQMEDRIVQYDQAIKSLEELREDVKDSKLPSLGTGNPKYDKAVLAIASTTQANASDKTTAHEAGTLKKYGLVNLEAIDSALADQKERASKFMKQLHPIHSAKSPAGEAAAPAEDPRIALAQKAVNSPAATPQQKANAAAFLKSQGR
jgi:hypothetical protein